MNSFFPTYWQKNCQGFYLVDIHMNWIFNLSLSFSLIHISLVILCQFLAKNNLFIYSLHRASDAFSNPNKSVIIHITSYRRRGKFVSVLTEKINIFAFRDSGYAQTRSQLCYSLSHKFRSFVLGHFWASSWCRVVLKMEGPQWHTSRCVKTKLNENRWCLRWKTLDIEPKISASTMRVKFRSLVSPSQFSSCRTAFLKTLPLKKKIVNIDSRASII